MGRLTPESSRRVSGMLPRAGGVRGQALQDAQAPQGAGWHVSRGGEAPGWRKQAHQPLPPARALPAPSPSRWAALHRGPLPPLTLQALWPGKNASLYLWMPLPFDSPLPSVSADLCVLGIQLEERTERMTAAPNPASAPPSTPGGVWAVRACLSCRALRWALWGLADWVGGRGGTLQMGPEVMLVNVTSQGRVEPSIPQNPAWGKGKGAGGMLAFARTGPPRPIGVPGT